MTTTADRPGSGAPRRAGPARRWAIDAAARRWAIDAAIAVAVTAAQLGAAYAGSSWHPGSARAGILSYVLLAAGGAALILRRRYPVGVLAVTLATTLWAAGQNSRTLYLALIVAFFTAVLAKKRIAAIGSLVIGYAASVWPFLIGESGHPSATFAVGLAAGLIFLLSAAELIRSRNQRTAALARSRAEELRRMAGEERMKMARDPHCCPHRCPPRWTWLRTGSSRRPSRTAPGIPAGGRPRCGSAGRTVACWSRWRTPGRAGPAAPAPAPAPAPASASASAPGPVLALGPALGLGLALGPATGSRV